jgi:alkylation response protein AidB-like acyl-CoA dehydrogenase
MVTCRTSPKVISCIAVPLNTPGLSFGINEKKMGWRSQPTRQVRFDNVRVPKSHLLGKEGEGFKLAMSGLDGGRLLIGACSLGAADACLEILLNWQKVLFSSFLLSFLFTSMFRQNRVIKAQCSRWRICMVNCTQVGY